jgi:hypothetical protein
LNRTGETTPHVKSKKIAYETNVPTVIVPVG